MTHTEFWTCDKCGRQEKRDINVDMILCFHADRQPVITSNTREPIMFSCELCDACLVELMKDLVPISEKFNGLKMHLKDVRI